MGLEFSLLEDFNLKFNFFRASLVGQLVKNLPAMQETWVRSLGWEDSSGERKGYPLQYSGLENSVDCIVHGVAKSRTRLSDFFTFTFSVFNTCRGLGRGTAGWCGVDMRKPS